MLKSQNGNSSGVRFYPLFSFLLENPKYKELTLIDIAIYGILACRARLSEQNNKFQDEDGRPFVYYAEADLEKLLHISHPTCVKSIRKLIKVGLILVITYGRGYANRIYVNPIYKENWDNGKILAAPLDNEFPCKKNILEGLRNLNPSSIETLLEVLKILTPNSIETLLEIVKKLTHGSKETLNEPLKNSTHDVKNITPINKKNILEKDISKKIKENKNKEIIDLSSLLSFYQENIAAKKIRSFERKTIHELEVQYGAEEVMESMIISVRNNKKSLNYVISVLKKREEESMLKKLHEDRIKKCIAELQKNEPQILQTHKEETKNFQTESTLMQYLNTEPPCIPNEKLRKINERIQEWEEYCHGYFSPPIKRGLKYLLFKFDEASVRKILEDKSFFTGREKSNIKILDQAWASLKSNVGTCA
ncbi:MAG: replication initiator protein A [Acidaminococcus sp.]|jgi:hypothetical protein|nr:replication initiator protein A [Acidaminococcus sp.]